MEYPRTNPLRDTPSSLRPRSKSPRTPLGASTDEEDVLIHAIGRLEAVCMPEMCEKIAESRMDVGSMSAGHWFVRVWLIDTSLL